MKTVYKFAIMNSIDEDKNDDNEILLRMPKSWLVLRRIFLKCLEEDNRGS
jgi:hypothetical protein